MASTGNLIFLIVALILACVTIATVAAGIAGNVWFSNDIVKVGLFKYCEEKITGNDEQCETREDIFSFDSDNKIWKTETQAPVSSLIPDYDIKHFDLDIIIVLAAVVALFTIPVIVALFCAIFVSRVKTKKSLALTAGILLIVAACAGAGSVGYAEHLMSDNLKEDNFDRGWSMILVWVSTGVAIIDAIIVLAGSCLMSDDSMSKYDDRNIPIDVRNQVNRGYEHNNDRANQRTVDVNDRFSTSGYNRPPSYNASVDQSKRSSRSEFKPELSHDKPLQTKFVYEDNKRNNRYKYSYNPEYMEQQFREEDSPQPPRYQPDYNRSRIRPSYDNPGYEIR